MDWQPLELVFHGHAQPAGSKRAFPRKGGGVVVADANPKGSAWKRGVARAAAEQYDGPLLHAPLHVVMHFAVTRPKGHYGSGRNAELVKASAPAHPAVKPDLLKLARAIEDALTGVVWRDDAQIVSEHLVKLYAERELVTVKISALP